MGVVRAVRGSVPRHWPVSTCARRPDDVALPVLIDTTGAGAGESETGRVLRAASADS